MSRDMWPLFGYVEVIMYYGEGETWIPLRCFYRKDPNYVPPPDPLAAICPLALSDTDRDRDGRDDACDNCPDAMNTNQADCDGNGIGDKCELDTDADLTPDACDNCPNAINVTQADCDGNGIGDWCDQDTDSDMTTDACDNCPTTSNYFQEDCDGDGIGTACDPENAIYSVQPVPNVPPICYVDRDSHFGYYTLEFRGGQLLTDISSCGAPQRYVTTLVTETDCYSGNEFQCCMDALPSSTPNRDGLCSHVDEDYCRNWPPPGAPQPPQPVCTGGGTLQSYTFCLINPDPLGGDDARCDEFAGKFEVLVQACSSAQAKALAQAHAVNWTLSEGRCPDKLPGCP